MNEILKELSRLAGEREKSLVAQKESGAPLVEYNSTFIPEELIRAAGANTFLMCRGGEAEPPDAVSDYMLRLMNPLARSTAGNYELGRDLVTTHADLVVTAQTDCHIGRLSELLEFMGVRLCKVGVPANWRSESAFDYYVRSLRRMLGAVEEITGRPVDMQLARRYMEQSNQINGCFRRINELRRGPETPIGFEDYMRLQHLSFQVDDAGLLISGLSRVCAQLSEAPRRFPADAPRLLLAGRVIAIGDYAIPRMFDEYGGAVVAEMLDECVRVTEKDLELDGDLVLNFTRNRYIDKLPVDIFQPSWTVRFERMKRLIDECRIDAVVWYQLSYDEIYDMEYTCVAKWLGELGVPILKLESDYSYSQENISLLSTRIESFLQDLRNM